VAKICLLLIAGLLHAGSSSIVKFKHILYGSLSQVVSYRLAWRSPRNETYGAGVCRRSGARLWSRNDAIYMHCLVQQHALHSYAASWWISANCSSVRTHQAPRHQLCITLVISASKKASMPSFIILHVYISLGLCVRTTVGLGPHLPVGVDACCWALQFREYREFLELITKRCCAWSSVQTLRVHLAIEHNAAFAFSVKTGRWWFGCQR